MAQVTRLGLYGYAARPYAGFSPAAANVVLSGTITGALESDIVAGGQTIILTLANDTWVSSGATFNAQRQNIIDGLDSAQSETTGWNNEVRDKEVVTAVARTSDTVVTITLSASSAYSISSDETITTTIPATALTGGNALVASPAFTVTNEAEQTQTRGGGYLSESEVRALERYLKPRKKKQKRREVQSRARELEALYDRIQGLIPTEEARPVLEALEPYATASDSRIPPTPAIDWVALARNLQAVEALAQALLDTAKLKNEDEEILLLMMSV